MFHTFVSALFRLCTLAFLLGGLVIVAGQGVGLLLGNGSIVSQVPATLSPFVYSAAGVAGLLAFVMSYSDGESDVDRTDTAEAVVVPDTPSGTT
ncbi:MULTISPECIES: hypothetical protein [unclassified Rhodococcus (in: high G+C Gram-positive bacteria)]|uniref:hypothetical protein n=1 Tax=unclassified Rhodococcus (in: high G+C Gram-positive bacteria) TaxID=192944 RepID=UPI0006FDB317|nr:MULTISPECIES: hypothetical protein [unclassified Rhodococcus (in: high G+C Gram-positive bacteria)]KQU28459.1 hypothetical protein ASG69_10660 [Rhodococcus sp. Leaf225]KQU47660.1 hypothetical protein ASH03_21400 [Rhodococcus sp. Leaf258]